MRQPTIFLSSTIFDFRDVRSAIKYFLEEQGCVVLASEFNDFNQPLEKHSYDACLQQIERADYFFLFIGARVGGWFDKQERISITQKEYRVAYELQKQGKLKIVSFVRSDVWTHKESLAELQRFLIDETAIDRERIINHPNKFMNDAVFIKNFIEEIGRNQETVQAVAGNGERPTANWIYTFRDFEDVVNVVKPLVFSGLPVAEAAFRRALKHELVELARTMLQKVDGKVLNPFAYVKQFHLKAGLNKNNRDDGFVTIDGKAWTIFSWVAYGLLRKPSRPLLLREAVATEFFLTYNRERGTFEVSEEFRAIVRLISDLERVIEANIGDLMQPVYKYSPKQIGRPTSIQMEFEECALLLSVAQAWANAIQLNLALVKTMTEGNFVMPELLPFSPLVGFDAHIAEGQATDLEVLEMAASF